jgi:AcrR family transcriptional regulator
MSTTADPGYRGAVSAVRSATDADQGQRRTSLAQSRSRETRRILLQAAIALWRTNGFAGTTVADISAAAGVSKALFHFYFPRKEDALLAAGVLSTREARRTARDLVDGPYELSDVIVAVLTTLERTMRHNPPELLVETVLEADRREHRALAAGRTAEEEVRTLLFHELFDQARTDGKLPPDLDVTHLARVAQSLMAAGTRQWAAGVYGDRSFADVVGRDIAAFTAGFGATPS